MAKPGEIPKQMLALRAKAGEKKVTLETIDVPEIGPDDVLIRVAAAHLAPDVFQLVSIGRVQPLPTTLGHKVAGVIDAVGSSVTNLRVGMRVRLDPNVNCGKCFYCNTDRDALCEINGVMGFFALGKSPLFDQYHNGGLAEYVCAPASCVDLLADHLSFDVGAKVHDLANAAAVLRRAAFPVGSTLLVNAATGSMGSAVLKMAPFFGVRRLILVARSAKRLEALKGLTSLECYCVATDQLDEAWETSNALTNRVLEMVPEGVDAVIDFTPEGTAMWQVIHALRIDGSFVCMGGNRSILPVASREMQLKCWRVLGHRNHSRQDSKLVIQLLESRVLQVEDLFTHHFQLEDWEKAIALQRSRSEPTWTLSILPPGVDRNPASDSTRDGLLHQ